MIFALWAPPGSQPTNAWFWANRSASQETIWQSWRHASKKTPSKVNTLATLALSLRHWSLTWLSALLNRKYRSLLSSSPCRSENGKTLHPSDKRLQKLDDFFLVHSATRTPQMVRMCFSSQVCVRVCFCVCVCVSVWLAGWLACLVLSVCLSRSFTFCEPMLWKVLWHSFILDAILRKDCWLVFSTPNLPLFAWKKWTKCTKPPTPFLWLTVLLPSPRHRNLGFGMVWLKSWCVTLDHSGTMNSSQCAVVGCTFGGPCSQWINTRQPYLFY